MSTEFVSQTTGETYFVRYSRTAGGCRTSFEFGTMTNWENVCRMVAAGDTFYGQGSSAFDDDPATVADFEEMVMNDRATFGNFPVTVAVGSGEMWRFSVEE